MALYRAHGKAFAEGQKNPRQNVNRKKPEKNSKIIFSGGVNEPSPPPAGFFVAFYTIFFTLFVKSWSVGFKLVTSHALSVYFEKSLCRGP
jgi:hypothetical protein